MSAGDASQHTAARFFEQLGEVNQRTVEHGAVLESHRARMDRFENRLVFDEQRRAQLQSDISAAVALIKENAVQMGELHRKHEQLQKQFFDRLTTTLGRGPLLALGAACMGSVGSAVVVVALILVVLRMKGIAL